MGYYILNEKTHSIRRKQSILSYGVGAMIDFPSQVLMNSSHEFWGAYDTLHDERLEKLLNVKKFVTPKERISLVRFPEWYFCPSCRRFKSIYDWVAQNKKNLNMTFDEKKLNLIDELKCPFDNQKLIPARIVTICEQGHIDDFPWIKWVHAKNKKGFKDVCNNPDLNWITGATPKSGLEGVEIECKACGARASLQSAFNYDTHGRFKNIFEELTNETSIAFRCEGKHPWKNTKEVCNCFPKTVQRGASSVYFPNTISSLLIPPYSDEINESIENTSNYDVLVNNIAEKENDISDHETLKKKIIDLIDSRITNIAKEIRRENEQAEIRQILLRKFIKNDSEQDLIMYRLDEYNALLGKNHQKQDKSFIVKRQNIADYDIPGIKSISLVHRLKEVTALTGFSRIQPKTEKMPGFVDIRASNTYPAIATYGEGIFIEFDIEILEEHFKNNSLIERGTTLKMNYNKSLFGQSRNILVDSKFVFLHTISHALIKELGNSSGYSTASIRERIYYGKANDANMCGILIYTTSGDEYGTLGGLVRLGFKDRLSIIFKNALHSIVSCSNDPVCSHSNGQGWESLNLAACHSCMLLPETSCEYNNSLLDRVLLVGLMDQSELGFFDNWMIKD